MILQKASGLKYPKNFRGGVQRCFDFCNEIIFRNVIKTTVLCMFDSFKPATSYFCELLYQIFEQLWRVENSCNFIQSETLFQFYQELPFRLVRI